MDRIIEFVAHDTAEQADEAGVAADPTALWGLAWRARATAWLLRNRRTLQNALS